MKFVVKGLEVSDVANIEKAMVQLVDVLFRTSLQAQGVVSGGILGSIRVDIALWDLRPPFNPALPSFRAVSGYCDPHH